MEGTRGYTELQEVTMDYKGFRGNSGYKRLQEDREGYKRLQ